MAQVLVVDDASVQADQDGGEGNVVCSLRYVSDGGGGGPQGSVPSDSWQDS